MASVTLPLTFLTTLSGQAANVIATITSIVGGVLRATVSAGWTEDTDATGAANAVYLNSVVADTSWGACRVKYTITGQAGVYGYDDVLLDFAAFVAKLTPGSLPFQVTAGSVSTSSSAALDGQELVFDPNYAQTLPVFTLGGIDSTGWTQFAFTLKSNPADADSAALLTVKVSNPAAGTDGLTVLNGAAPSGGTSAADGTLLVTATTPDTLLTLTLTARGAAIPFPLAATALWELTRYAGGAATKYVCGTGPAYMRARVRINPVAS